MSTVDPVVSPQPSYTPSPTFTITPSPALSDTLTPTTTPTATFEPAPTLDPTPTSPVVTTLLFTGVIVPARCVQAALDKNGNPDYPYEEVRGVIQDADLSIGVFNATMSEFPPHTGCHRTYVLVGSPDNADALARAGFDLMSVATNHIKDCGITTCGDRAFFDTLENLKRVGILTVGAGKDLPEALQPAVVTINGVRFGFVSLGDSKQGDWTFAGPDSPGIAQLTPENVQAAINTVKPLADVVIALPHWGPEDISVPNWIQRNEAQQIVQAGANIVVGNHTHVVQGIQQIDGVPVFYGLGNFVFDQDLTDHQQGVILLVRFEGTRYIGYELIPTHVDTDGSVHIAGSQEAAEIVQRIEQASKGLR